MKDLIEKVRQIAHAHGLTEEEDLAHGQYQFGAPDAEIWIWCDEYTISVVRAEDGARAHSFSPDEHSAANPSGDLVLSEDGLDSLEWYLSNR